MLIDFEYDGKKLSDFGYIICHITGSADAEAISISSPLIFDTQIQKVLGRFRPMSAYYEEPYTFTIEIAKNFCGNGKASKITEEDVRALMKWLSFRGYAKYKPFYDDLSYSDIYYNGSFNVQAVRLGGEIIGFELTFTADSPYAFHDPVIMEWEFEGMGEFHIHDSSDEYGIIYPKVEITCLGDGNFIMWNDRDGEREGNETKIENCTAGEVIKLDGYNKIISSSREHLSLYNDFSFVFTKIHTTHSGDLNTFIVSAPCKLTMTYSPVCKVGVI